MINVQAYFESLSLELRGLQNRVRNLISDQHWQTDGEWKESVIRYFLQRNAPKDIAIGRGFVIGERGTSTQTDVLLYDRNCPVLFQDGDLVFITQDSLRGMIEVKSRVDRGLLRGALIKMTRNMELFATPCRSQRFFAVFAFESTVSTEAALEEIKAASGGHPGRRLDLACLGYSHFVKWWELDPENRRTPVHRWQSYRLTEKAPGYFLHNVIAELAQNSVHDNQHLWFPREGKEGDCDGSVSFEFAQEYLEFPQRLQEPPNPTVPKV